MLHITTTTHSLACELPLLCSHGVAVRATNRVHGTNYVELQVQEACCFLLLPVKQFALFVGEASF